MCLQRESRPDERKVLVEGLGVCRGTGHCTVYEGSSDLQCAFLFPRLVRDLRELRNKSLLLNTVSISDTGRSSFIESILRSLTTEHYLGVWRTSTRDCLPNSQPDIVQTWPATWRCELFSGTRNSLTNQWPLECLKNKINYRLTKLASFATVLPCRRNCYNHVSTSGLKTCDNFRVCILATTQAKSRMSQRSFSIWSHSFLFMSSR